jgi:uncharacterized protein
VPDESKTLKFIAESVEHLEELLGFLPGDVVKDLRAKIATLRGIVLEQRPPAVVLIGRRGAGKSSLINALFGEKVAEIGHIKSQTGRGRWFDFKGPAGTLSILDTRGVQEGSAPEEADEAKGAIASIVGEIHRKAPDVILFLVKASEVDAAIDGDLAALDEILIDLDRVHKHKPPILAIVTHCDVLEPKGVRLDDPDGSEREELDEKLVHVAAAERQIEAKLKARTSVGPQLVKTLGVSTYMSFRADGTVRADERWHIDELSRLLFEHIPDAGRGMFVRVARYPAIQEDLALNLTRATAALCGGIAALPIPVADIVPITAMQLSLIAGVAWLSGRAMDSRAAGEFLAGLGVNVGAAFAMREAARALTKFVFPGAGAAVSGTVAFAGTMAIGAAARAYFIRGASMAEAKARYERVKAAKGHDEDDGPRDPEGGD